MNADPFEHELQRQPLRTVPVEWRAPVLAAARASARSQSTTVVSWPKKLSEWLWPHPYAWGGLAACWIAILFLHHATAPTAEELAQARRDARVAAAYSTFLGHPSAVAILAEPAPDPPPTRSERRPPDLGERHVPSRSAWV